METSKPITGINRRDFIKTAGAGGAALGIGFPSIIPCRVLAQGTSPNSKIGVGIIGCGSRGQTFFQSDNNAHCVATCDPVRA